jgi:hypothetical protein
MALGGCAAALQSYSTASGAKADYVNLEGVAAGGVHGAAVIRDTKGAQ